MIIAFFPWWDTGQSQQNSILQPVSIPPMYLYLDKIYNKLIITSKSIVIERLRYYEIIEFTKHFYTVCYAIVSTTNTLKTLEDTFILSPEHKAF